MIPRPLAATTLSLPALLLAASWAAADSILFSVGVTAEPNVIGGVTLDPGDVVLYDTIKDETTLLVDSSSVFDDGNGFVNAVHALPNGNLIISSQADTTVQGESYGAGDLIEYNPSDDTAQLFLGEIDVFGSSFEDIDAVYVRENGNVVFSVSEFASVDQTGGGTLFLGAGDVVDYDPQSNSGTLLFDEDNFGGFLGENVNGLHVRQDGNLLLSNNDPTAVLGGLTFGSDDVAEYDLAADVATLFFEGSAAFTNGDSGFIVSLSLLPETVEAELSADFDSDLNIDGGDFLLWQSGFGMLEGAARSDGDADGDGDVDRDDFVQWQIEYALPAGNGVSTVPEPATWPMALALAMVTRAPRRVRFPGQRLVVERQV